MMPHLPASAGLFANAEGREDAAEQVVGRDPPRDLAQGIVGQPQFFGDQFQAFVKDVTAEREDYEPLPGSTATRTDTPSLETPQSIQVVPQAVIRDQNALTLTEAVRNVAGVQYDFGFNGSMQPLLILRGFSSTSMTAMGPMSGSSTYYLDGSKVTGVPVNMANVQSVEVIKGPASVLFGQGRPGGVINVVSKKPEADHVNSILAAGRADLCAVARPHLANPAWTLTEAARIGFKDLAWPAPYVSGKPQLEAGFARERALQSSQLATKGD